MQCGITGETMKIYGSGDQVRDYTYISDVIDGTCLSIRSVNKNGTVYNLGKGKGDTIKDLANLVSDLCGQRDIKFEDGENRYADQYCIIPSGLTSKTESGWIDERNYIANIEAAKMDFGYNPRVDLKQGVTETMEWMKKCLKQ